MHEKYKLKQRRHQEQTAEKNKTYIGLVYICFVLFFFDFFFLSIDIIAPKHESYPPDVFMCQFRWVTTYVQYVSYDLRKDFWVTSCYRNRIPM